MVILTGMLRGILLCIYIHLCLLSYFNSWNIDQNGWKEQLDRQAWMLFRRIFHEYYDDVNECGAIKS